MRTFISLLCWSFSLMLFSRIAISEEHPIDPAAVEELKILAAAESLHLSSDKSSAYANFSFRATFWPIGGADRDCIHVFIERSGDQTMMLSTNADGLPFGYVNNEASYRLDTTALGQWAVTPLIKFQFRSTGANGFHLNWFLDDKNPNSTIDFDPRVLCRDIIPVLTSCSFDAKKRVIVAKLSGASIEIHLTSNPIQPYPVERILLKPDSGVRTTLDNFKTGKEYFPALVGIGKKNIDALSIKKMNVDIKNMKFFDAQDLIPLPSFWEHEENSVAAQMMLRAMPAFEKRYAIGEVKKTGQRLNEIFYWYLVLFYDEMGNSLLQISLSPEQQARTSSLVQAFRLELNNSFKEMRSANFNLMAVLRTELGRQATLINILADVVTPSQYIALAKQMLASDLAKECPDEFRSWGVATFDHLCSQKLSDEQRVEFGKIFTAYAYKVLFSDIGSRLKKLDEAARDEVESKLILETLTVIIGILNKEQLDIFEKYIKSRAN